MSESAPTKKRPTGLGRGLSALLGDIAVEAPVASVAGGAEALPQGVRLVDVGGLRPMENQPRKNFDDAPLDELADSIKARGLLQPIVVRPIGPDREGHYEIVAGERRWRAAQRAGLHQVPVIIREFDDLTALELAIIENIQREQLNAWEEGDAYRRLVDEHGYSQEQVGKITGKSRSHIANLMRLRQLPQAVHDWLTAGKLTMGHARALIGCDDAEALARQVVARHLNVRQTEALVRRGGKPGKKSSSPAHNMGRDADILALERQLSDLLGIKTEIRHQQRSGSVLLHYSTLEQLDMICQRLSGERI